MTNEQRRMWQSRQDNLHRFDLPEAAETTRLSADDIEPGVLDGGMGNEIAATETVAMTNEQRQMCKDHIHRSAFAARMRAYLTSHDDIISADLREEAIDWWLRIAEAVPGISEPNIGVGGNSVFIYWATPYLEVELGTEPRVAEFWKRDDDEVIDVPWTCPAIPHRVMDWLGEQVKG